MSLFNNLFGENEKKENEVEKRYDNPLEILDKQICEDPSYDLAYKQYEELTDSVNFYDSFYPDNGGPTRDEVEQILTGHFDIVQRELFEDDILVEYKYGPYDDPNLGEASKATIAVNYINGFAAAVTYTPGKFDLKPDSFIANEMADRVIQPHIILDLNGRALSTGWTCLNGDWANLYMTAGSDDDGNLLAHYYLFVNSVAKYYIYTPLTKAVVDMPMNALIVFRNYEESL